MNYRKFIIAALACALLGGCATRYGDVNSLFAGMAGGYWDEKGTGDLIKVGFSGNGFIAKEKVGTYLLYRCAEIAKREGKPF